MRYFYLLRVHHWPKNFFLFIPAFFGGMLTELGVIDLLLRGFICFSFASSAVYILNDYRDREADKLHPTKKGRPLASGKVSPLTAVVLMILLSGTGLIGAFLLNPTFGFALVGYLGINISYSFGLKHISLLDTMLVSSGFLLRTLAGGWLVDVPVSHWLVVMVFLLSFFLAMAKRRDDLVLFKSAQVPLRQSSKGYSIDFANTVLSLLAGIIIVSYIMYTLSDEVVQRWQNDYLYITSLFVFLGILRFLQIVMVEERGGSPTRIFLTDRFIQLTIAAWVLSFILIIYLNKV
jgi:decaprenyl-phosphate phosphoribosyltransferase